MALLPRLKNTAIIYKDKLELIFRESCTYVIKCRTCQGCAFASYLLFAVNLCDTGSGCDSSVDAGGRTLGASFLSQSISS